MTKTATFRLRLAPDELETWQVAAQRAGESLSRYVRGVVTRAVTLETTLREQAEQQERQQREREERARELLREMYPNECVCVEVPRGVYCDRCRAIRKSA